MIPALLPLSIRESRAFSLRLSWAYSCSHFARLPVFMAVLRHLMPLLVRNTVLSHGGRTVSFAFWESGTFCFSVHILIVAVAMIAKTEKGTVNTRYGQK
ncbi:MAG: hypothetical protein E7618_02945 [Ruminococcaceae bacterium]|nr:hypothetical protein [Oscillospiraceae bacterium]